VVRERQAPIELRADLEALCCELCAELFAQDLEMFVPERVEPALEV
jgi:hypothetical protein